MEHLQKPWKLVHLTAFHSPLNLGPFLILPGMKILRYAYVIEKHQDHCRMHGIDHFLAAILIRLISFASMK